VTPKVDHVVIDARDRIDEALRTYLSLGFQLTDRGRHTLGSVNHLAIFDTDYIELLGFDDTAGVARADILRFPVGLNGLVFATDEPEVLFGDLCEHGLAVEQPIAFSRPVALADRIEDAKFRVVRLGAGAVCFGRVYFCHHLTPKLVWRPEWRRHPNGALALGQVTIAAQDPASASILFGRTFGPNAVRQAPNGVWRLAAGAVQVDLMVPEMLTARFGSAAPDPAGRTDYMAGLCIRTASLSQAARVLQVAHIPDVKIESQRIIVPASQAMNVVLEFVE
jgi:catechol 2,3-dioxygenase-like lactoylglutathione lyase family enzyme